MALTSFDSLAFTPTVTGSGAPVRWHAHPQFNLNGNPQNQSNIDAPSFHAAVTRGLQRWRAASGSGVDFRYWQGTDLHLFPPNSDYNGISSIYFASNARGGGSPLTANILGLTQVWYRTDTGEILEADVALNDKDFVLTTDPRNTSGYGSGGTSFISGKNAVYIENIITHELGHAFGLSHSGGLQSTMLFMESPEQAHLGCDDQIGIRALYSTSDLHGGIRGGVVSETGSPVFGAHVLAVSRRRGTVLATGLTDKSGQFSIGALEPGAYFLMVEPFYAGSQALPPYYSSIDPGSPSSSVVCSGGRPFVRSILSGTSGFQPVSVTVSSTGSDFVLAPPWVVKCSSRQGAAVSMLGSFSTQNPIVVYEPASDGSGFGVVDQLDFSRATYYRLNHLSGHVEIHALSYSLYSPAHARLSLLDTHGETVPAVTKSDPVYTGDSGYVNFDSSLVADALPEGSYDLQVTASSLNLSLYPAGPISLDSVPFVLVTGSVNESPPSLAGILPLNARCRMDENFPPYSSPTGDPPQGFSQTHDRKIGFCGTTLSSSPGQGDRSSPPFTEIIGFFLPWVGMGVFIRWFKRFRFA